MNQSPISPPSSPRPTATLVCLGFFALGILSFWAGTATMFRHPEMLFGEPYRPEVLTMVHLMILGWVSSLIFGAGYMILPVMAAVRLWSLRLAWIHLILHAVGMPWMLTGFVLMDFAEVGHGGTAVFVGMILFIINLVKTASRFNRWEPAQITFIDALFWLLVTSGLAMGMMVNKYIPIFRLEPQSLIAIHAHLGLIGFLWMILLGASLKLFPMFLISKRNPGVFSWVGCILLNIGLLMIVLTVMTGQESSRNLVIGAILLGSLSYVIDVGRVWLSSQRNKDWGVYSALTGLVFGIVLIAWAWHGGMADESIMAEGLRGQARIYFALALFGPFTFAIFGMGTRIIPFLSWQLRYAPRVGREVLPTVRDLVREEGLFPLWVSLVCGWLFLAMGLLSGEVFGVQIGLMLFLVATGWFFYVLLPALRTMVAEDVRRDDAS
jgi:hypothetical protein